MTRNQTLESNFFTIMVMALFILLTGVIQSAEGQDYKLRPLSLKEVRVTDQFWVPRIETNRTVTIPLVFHKCEEKGYISSFAKAGGLMQGEFKGEVGSWSDTDVYKVIEGASYSLQNHPDRDLQNYIDGIGDKIAAAQWEDGYLYTRYSLPLRQPGKRYCDVALDHEIFCAGELLEMAVAYFEATGKGKILDVAIRSADHLDSVFGPDKRRDVPGHQVVELALVKLYRITGNEKYLKLAKFFLDERGHAHGRKLHIHKGIVNSFQDHKPVIEQSEAVGHAVRAVYMYSGMTDVAALTGDAGYLKALDRIWENVVSKKMYINGGVGVRWEGEAFGDNYELPNRTAHCETCAAIANVFWNHRMSLLHGDAKYIDVLELALYNRVLAGISLDGSSTFYKGPLASDGEWIRDATRRTPIKDNLHCCVTNLVRLFPQIGRYIFATDDDGIYVNLYAGSNGKVRVKDKHVVLTQETRYPWEGAVKITLNTAEPMDFDLNLRIPGWCVDASPVSGDLYRFGDKPRQNVLIKINGKAEKTLATKKGYARLSRRWKSGDVVELSLPMPIRRVYSNPKVKNNIGRVAIMRGPMVYCAEGVDNDGDALNLLLTDDQKLRSEYRKDLLGGVTVILGKASVVYPGKEGKSVKKKNREFTAIPYYAWANRGPAEMAIWLANDPSTLMPVAPPTIASASQVTTSRFWDKMRLHAYTINDQLEPKSSDDRSAPQFNWWPLAGGKEWVQYDFKKPEKISAVKVYWFDEQPGGGCRVPKSWRLLYKDGGDWKRVEGASEYSTKRDHYNHVTFESVETTALRIELVMQPNFSTGILEWRVE